MTAWLSLFWNWILPALLALPVARRMMVAHRARQRGMLSTVGWRWLALAFALAQIYCWLIYRTVTRPTDLWSGTAAVLATVIVTAISRRARRELHVGLAGFARPLPQDGLDLIESAKTYSRDWWWCVPAQTLLVIVLLVHPQRALAIALVMLAALAAYAIIPYRQQWRASLLLTLPALVAIALAINMRHSLPPGNWDSPVSGARCAGQVRLWGDRAWCADVLTHRVYQFNLHSGVVIRQKDIAESVRVLAANDRAAWIQQDPAFGLLLYQGDEVTQLSVPSAHYGVADAQNRLWVIDVGNELTLYEGGAGTPLRARHGLLNNTANAVATNLQGDVWVGSISGVSWLRAGQAEWQTLDSADGLTGQIFKISFAADGDVWLLWRGRGNTTDWGAYRLTATGAVERFDIGALTGLDVPLVEDSLAADGLGRVWIVTQSLPRREQILALVDVNRATFQIFFLGAIPGAGPYAYGRSLWQQSVGVTPDGSGGVILFNGLERDWLRWRP